MPSHYDEDGSLQPNAEVSIVPDPYDQTEDEALTVPSNLDRETAKFAAALDEDEEAGELFSVSDEGLANTRTALENGQREQLVNRVLTAETLSYMKPLEEALQTVQVQNDPNLTQQYLERMADLDAEMKDNYSKATKFQKEEVVSRRAVERVAATNKGPKPDPVALDQVLAEAAKTDALATHLWEVAGQRGFDLGWTDTLDVLGFVGGILIPFWGNVNYQQSMQKVLEKAMGTKLPATTNYYQQTKQAREMYMSLDPAGRQAFVETLVDGSYGIFGSNKLAALIAFDMILSADAEEHEIESVLAKGGLGLDALFALPYVVSKVKKMAGVVNVVRKAAGGKKAGEMVGDAIVNKATDKIGLNEPEAVGKSISAGRLPYDDVENGWEGGSEAAQAAMREAYNNAIHLERNKIDASGISPVEKAARLEELKQRVVGQYGNRIHSMEFTEDGAGIRIRLHDENGNKYYSEADARAAARNAGMADDAYRLVDEEGLAETRKLEVEETIDAYHGGSVFEWFKKEFIGSGHGGKALGHGFNAALARGMAERFALGRAKEGKKAYVFDLKLPDEKFLLDFDKPLNKQSAHVKKALAQALTGDELLALKNKKGSDVYAALVQRTGSDVNASDLLDSKGILGNIGTSGIKDREVIIFNEKVMNDAIQKRTPFKAGKIETAEEKLARLAEEAAEDEAALAEISPVQRSLDYYGSYLSQNKTVSAAMEQSHPFFTEGRLADQKYIKGPSVPDDLSEWAQKFNGFLKFPDDHQMIILMPEDVSAFIRKASKEQPEGMQMALIQWGLEVKRTKRGAGAHTNFTWRNGKQTSVIILGKHGNYLESLKTLAHEIGHSFKDFVFARLPKHEQRMWIKRFVDEKRAAGLKAGDMDSLERWAFKMTSQTPDRVPMIIGLMEEARRGGSPTRGKFVEKWFKSFNEYLSEQMSKYAMTDPEVRALSGSVWKSFANDVANFFRKVAQIIKMAADNGFDVSLHNIEPDKWFKEMMDKHRLGDDTSLDFTGGVLDMPPPKPVKPRIKAKVPGAPRSSGKLLEIELKDTFGSIKGYDPKDIENTPWFSLDPRNAVSVDTMMGRIVGVHHEASIKAEAKKLLAPLNKLKKKERQRVLAVLEEGDQFSAAGGFGKEFTGKELIMKGLTEREIDGYRAARSQRFLDYFLRNAAMVEVGRAKGLKEVELFGHGKFLGKPLPREQATGKALNLATNTLEEVSPELYDQGYRIIQAETPQELAGQLVTRILVKDADATVRELHTAIHYRPGEFARIYDDPYFIQVKKIVTVDGVRKEIDIPVKTAKTQKEADGWIKAVTSGIDMVKSGATPEELSPVIGKYYAVEDFVREVQEGSLKDFTGAFAHYTNQKEAYVDRLLQHHSHHGRLFTSGRGEHILNVLDRTGTMRSNILDPYASLQAEVSMTARFASVNMWKEAQMHKWVAAFADLIPQELRGLDPVQIFSKMEAQGFTTTAGKRGKHAKRMHRYISRQIGLQNEEQRWYQEVQRGLAEIITNNWQTSSGEAVGAFVRDASPLNFIRAVNHHVTLGAFNPAQLLVQAAGATVAMTLHPVHGLAAVTAFPAIRFALMSDNPKVIASLGKAADMDDMARVAAAIRKVGLLENLKSTSLHNLQDGKVDFYASLPKRAIGEMADRGMFLFNRGEEFARVVSFDVARREWMKANPGKAWDTDEALQKIVLRADDYTMNMTRANLARWQQGVMSIPLQFFQYNLKMGQNIIKGMIGSSKTFSRADASKLLAGQLVMWGAAGFGANELLGEWLGEENVQSMNPTVRTALGQGAMAALLKMIAEGLGAERFDIALGSRLGSVNFFTELAKDLYNDDKKWAELLLGPTYTTGNRLRIVGDVVAMWRHLPDLTVRDVKEGVLAILRDQFSSTRNATKAYMALEHGNRLQNRKGEDIVELSAPEIVAQALGLQPSAAYDYYNMVKSERERKQALNDISDRIIFLQKKYLEALKNDDRALAERYIDAISLMLPQNQGDFGYIQRRVRERLAPFDNHFQKLLHEHALRAGENPAPFMTTSPLDKVK